MQDIGNTGTYKITQQYPDGSGPPGETVIFGGSYTDTNAFPNGEGSSSKPVKQTDIEMEIQHTILSKNPRWRDDVNHQIYVFLPRGIVQDDSAACAYHTVYALPGENGYTHTYAVMPYIASMTDCGALGQKPNGDVDADDEISALSHELIESVTDPTQDASHNPLGWYFQDRQHEIGDECAYVFPATGFNTPHGGDITLQSHEYAIQEEWSNALADPSSPSQQNGCTISAPFSGDVFIGVANGQVQWRGPDGTLRRTLNTGANEYTTGMAFDQSGNLYVTNFGAGSVSRFSDQGQLVGTFGSGYSEAPESILFNQAGDAFVGAESGDVLEFDPNGTMLKDFPTGRSDWVELGPDQCALYYTDEGTAMHRFNVCTDAAMPDFLGAGTLEHPYALRLLPSGGLLAADSSSVRRFDQTGAQIQSYTYPGNSNWFALNLDPDGTSFWSADFSSSSVVRFDIASGNVLNAYNTGTPTETVFGIIVKGELTQGAGAEVFGTAKDQAGTAIDGAIVQACPHTGGSCFESKTSSAGSYQLTGIDPGSYDLTAFPPAGTALVPTGIGPVQLSRPKPARKLRSPESGRTAIRREDLSDSGDRRWHPDHQLRQALHSHVHGMRWWLRDIRDQPIPRLPCRRSDDRLDDRNAARQRHLHCHRQAVGPLVRTR